MVLQRKPKRGGFLRPFGCGWFIKEFLSGNGHYGSLRIDPSIGATQSDIFYYYKHAIIRETALDRATRTEEKRARREKRAINPDNIDKLFRKYLARLPYKAQGCRYHSFVTYFSTIQKLGWAEFTGEVEPSEFQENYPQGQPRKYFRLTAAGMAASVHLWANPHKALYS
jgi:hypothetical protein